MSSPQQAEPCCKRVGEFHILQSSDDADYRMRLDGRTFRFEWSDRFGPLLIGKRGQVLENQKGPKLFLVAVTQWRRQGKRICDGGFCVWRPEPAEVFFYISTRVAKYCGVNVLQEDRC